MARSQAHFFVKLLKLVDVDLQTRKFLNWLNSTSPEEVVCDLESQLKKAVSGDQAMRSFLNPYFLSKALLDEISTAKRAEFFRISQELNFYLAAGLFADFSPVQLEPPLPTFRIADVRLGKRDKKDPITLGERRSLAKTNNIKILEKLLTDPDEKVIQTLLNNAHLSEKHVLKICSRRPTRAAILKAVAMHPKWGRNSNVRFALIQNPYTLPLVATLSLIAASRSQLEETVQAETLHPTIRNLARAILKEMTASGVGDEEE